MASEDFCPKNNVLETIIHNVVVPILNQIELELEIGLKQQNYKFSVFIDDREECYNIIDFSGKPSSEENLQYIRVRFRPIFDPNKLKFRIESVFSEGGLTRKIGFSGFTAKGTINTDDLTIKEYIWSICYNVWNWRGWIR